MPTHFPRLTARNLNGRTVSIPEELEGELLVMLVAFRREHQALVDSWLPFLEGLAGERPGLRFYEIPTIGTHWAPARWFIDGGMVAAIRDRDVRERTLTVYTHVRRVLRDLALPDASSIGVFLLDPDDRILWRGRGGHQPALAEDLARAIEAVTDRGDS